MMIPLKNLDHKSFIEILQEARQNIHRFTKEWTDENYHDPGITLLELTSWLTEMQRYYLNRVTDRNYQSLFKLMGIERQKNGYAKTVMQLKYLKEDRVIPKNMKFVADEQIFETRKSCYYSSNTLKSVYIQGDQIQNLTHLNHQDGIYFKLFGDQVREGNQCILLLEKPLIPGEIIQFYIDINEQYPVSMNSEPPLLETFSVTCYQDLNQLTEVEVVEDETHGFRTSGILSLKLKKPHAVSHMMEDQGYAIVFRAAGNSWMIPPEANAIRVNVVNVFNQNTVVDYKIAETKTFEVNSELIHSSYQVQGSEDGVAWEDIAHEQVELLWNKKVPSIRVSETYGFYRVVYYDDKQLNERTIGSGNGIANTRLRFRADRIVFNEMLLHIGEKVGRSYRWYDWHYTEDILKAGSSDRVFTYDFEEEELVFGNHEHGMVPERLEQNIRIGKLIKTDYQRGNVKKGHINALYSKTYPLEMNVSNIKDAVGGIEAQKMADVHEHAYKSYGQVTRAITLQHYETLVKNAPGYRISYCKALNNHVTENQITLVIVPYNGHKYPVLSSEMKRGLVNYLEDYRLITTRIDIADPVYVETSLYATLKVKNRNRFNRSALTRYFMERLTPVQGYVVNTNYAVGSIPSKAEIIEELLMDPDVLNVDQIAIECMGLGVRRSTSGDPILPKNAVIYAKEVIFTVTD